VLAQCPQRHGQSAAAACDSESTTWKAQLLMQARSAGVREPSGQVAKVGGDCHGHGASRQTAVDRRHWAMLQALKHWVVSAGTEWSVLPQGVRVAGQNLASLVRQRVRIRQQLLSRPAMRFTANPEEICVFQTNLNTYSTKSKPPRARESRPDPFFDLAR
jgi:hypothetical protein